MSATVSNPWKVKPTQGSADIDTPPAGTHPAVLVAMIDLGTHEENYQGRDYTARKVYLVWELVTEVKPGTKDSHFLIGRDYNLTLGPKAALRKMIEGWRGKNLTPDEDFDLLKMLGQKCLLNVKHTEPNAKGSIYAKIDGVTNVPKGMTVPNSQRKPIAWSLADDEGDIPDWLPYIYGKPVAEKIQECLENTNPDRIGDDANQHGSEDGPEHHGNAPGDIPF